jgi:hypothetical protein
MIDAGFEILNQRGTPMFFSDTFANRPAAGIVGRIFISTDTNEIFRDTGSGWNLIGSGSGGIGGSIIAGQVAFGTATNTIGGSNALQWDNTNQRLGVGVGVPTSQLHLFGNAPVINSSTNVSNQFHGLELSLGTSLDAFFKQRPDTGELRISNGRTTIWNGFITFYTDTTEKMRITPLGRLLLNTTTDTGERLQVNGTSSFLGNITLGLNQNAATGFTITNTTSGTAANSFLKLQTTNSSTYGEFAKLSASYTTYKIFVSNDLAIYNTNTSGDIAILNDFATGRIKFSAGGSSTAQMTLQNTGNLLLGSVTDSGQRLQVIGDSYLNGRLGLGTTTLTAINLNVDLNISGAVQSVAIQQNGVVQSGVTSAAFGIFNGARLQSTAFTLTNYYHYWTQQSTLSGGSAITNQYGYWVDSTLIGATNNFGFYGNIASGTNRWNLYMNGTANNYMAGSLGIGSVSITDSAIRVAKNMTGGTTYNGVYNDGTVQSDVTTSAIYFRTQARTAASVVTSNIVHYYAQSLALGAGSTVTNQFGFHAENNLIGATNNYGFYGNIAAATGRWNLYMVGTALNYMNGALLLGSSTSSGEQLQVTGTQLNTDTRTYSTGSIQSVRLIKNLTIPSGSTISSSNSIFTLIGAGTTTFQGSVSIPNSTPFATGYLANVYNITAAATTITSDQAAGGIRSLSQLNLSNYFGGTNSGTLTHVSTLQLAGFYNNNSGSITPTITNAYQLLINDIGDYGHTFTYTNRWAIYQEGLNDRNYLNGKLLIGSTSDTGEKVQITGSIRVNGQLSGSAGGNSGTHLIIYCDGTQYKISLLNP